MQPEKDYSPYCVQDFVMDDYFRKWVQNPDANTNAFWHSWLAEHPQKKPYIDEARQIVLHLSFQTDLLPEQSMNRIWQKLDTVYEEQKVSQHLSPVTIIKQAPAKGLWNRWYAMAAVFTIVLLGSAIVYFLLKPTDTFITQTTQYGQTKTLYLPDSSTVTLNANSSLRFSDTWNSKQIREVWLEGEAYFHVLKKNNATGPSRFIVHTRQLQVEVLGTTFTVNNRHGNTKVVLNSGKVKLAGNGPQLAEPLVMQPGEYVEFSEKDKQLTRKLVNPSYYSSWTENKLIFNNTTLAEIAQLIEDNYGLKVYLKDKALAGRSFTATLPAGNMQTLLLALEESFQIKVTRQKNKVFLENY
jgi:ferric-dicitrate binding protein FerR (iron transport regulator)